jgi:hypothetical protein
MLNEIVNQFFYEKSILWDPFITNLPSNVSIQQGDLSVITYLLSQEGKGVDQVGKALDDLISKIMKLPMGDNPTLYIRTSPTIETIPDGSFAIWCDVSWGIPILGEVVNG